MTHNPFVFGRFEHEKNPIIFKPDTYEKYKSGKNYFLEGSRGTGKTAILRWLCWEDRSNRKSTFSMEKKEFKSDSIIGLYVRIADYQLPNFKVFNNNEIMRDYVFGWYLSLLKFHLLMDALSKLISRGYINISPKEEINFCRRFYKENKAFFSEIEPQTFSELANKLFSLQMNIHTLIIREQMDDIPDVFLNPYLNFFKETNKNILESIPIMNDWRVFICFDEAEVFKPWQQKIVNGFVRNSKDPWTYLIAYIEDSYNKVKTNLNNQPLSDSDREIEALDQLEFSDFKKFAEGIIRLRLEKHGFNFKDFNIKDFFGSNNNLTNKFLEKHLSISTKEESNTLLERANNNRDIFNCENKELPAPIYQTWLLDLDPKIKVTGEENKRELRRISSATLRKRHLATYHRICNEFSFKPKYAGYRTIIEISDYCVRDFLRYLYFLYINLQKSNKMNEFLSENTQIKPIPINIQSKSAREASENKFKKSISDEVVYSPEKVENIINNTQNILNTHQSFELSPLDPDRGTIRIKPYSKISEELLNTIEEARLCGLIHSKTNKLADQLEFKLHRMLTVYSDLPYRKPSSYIDIPAYESENLLEDNIKDSQINKWLSPIFQKINKNHSKYYEQKSLDNVGVSID